MTSSSIMVALTMDDFYYQITGMVVVASCLIFLSLILTVSGSVAVKLEESRKAKAAAAKAAADAAKAQAAAKTAAPTPAASPAAEMSPAQVAAMAAGIYDAARSSITPEIVAVIAAAVRTTMGDDVRILSIQPKQSSFANSGRHSIMNSHFPKKG